MNKKIIDALRKTLARNWNEKWRVLKIKLQEVEEEMLQLLTI